MASGSGLFKSIDSKLEEAIAYVSKSNSDSDIKIKEASHMEGSVMECLDNTIIITSSEIILPKRKIKDKA
ncbi:hypothetical protein [Vibrio mediterranei]|uniref:DUF2642 domain-containing protein n=1 Tax=Vibrio mediterranei TaxID=689 RepID=A0ABX5D685_9VIBR|nr:hypothetical protein [Vibrio mediterranei]PRQ65119.1 hypothetical protein COR51_23650 [Vibrio mediterranei]